MPETEAASSASARLEAGSRNWLTIAWSSCAICDSWFAKSVTCVTWPLISSAEALTSSTDALTRSVRGRPSDPFGVL